MKFGTGSILYIEREYRQGLLVRVESNSATDIFLVLVMMRLTATTHHDY